MGLRALQPRVALADLRTAALPPKVADRFYSSLAWIALRDRVRREAGGRCQVPGCGRIERGMIVDHIVELKDGGVPLDRSNTRLMCRSHHNQKTDTERAKRTARRPGDLDPWGFWGALPDGGSRREFFLPAKTTARRIFPVR